MKTVKNNAVRNALLSAKKAEQTKEFKALLSNKPVFEFVVVEVPKPPVTGFNYKHNKMIAHKAEMARKAKARLVSSILNSVYTWAELINGKAEAKEAKKVKNLAEVTATIQELDAGIVGSALNLVNRKAVVEQAVVLHNTVISDLWEKEGVDVSNPVRQMIYSLINLKRMMNIGELLIANIESGSETEVREYCSALRNVVRYNCTMAEGENAFKYAFGSNINGVKTKPFSDSFEHGTAVKKALEDAGVNLGNFRKQYSVILGYANMFDEQGYLLQDCSIRLNAKCVTTRLGNGKPKSIDWSDLAKKIEYAHQIIVTKTNKKGDVALEPLVDTENKKGFGLVRRALAMHHSAVELSGLTENKDFLAVVNISSVNEVDTAVHIDSPFAHNLTAREKESVAGQTALKIANKVLGAGYITAYKAETFGEHGYIQKGETVLKGDNSFITKENGKYITAEKPSKLVVRLAKCAQAKSRHIVKNVNMHVLVLSELGLNASPEQIEFNRQLEKALVTGQTFASPELFRETGVCRVVGGANVGETGAKTVLVDPLFTLVQEALGTVAMSIGGIQGMFVGRYAIAGLTSTKAASFKTKEGLKQHTVVFQGAEVNFWIKSTKEQLQITDSAVTEAFEVNTDNLTKLTGTEAAVDTYLRRITGKKSDTVFDLVYGGRGANESLADVVARLLEKGVIRSKKAKSRLNAQVVLGADFQHGRAVGEALVKSTLSQNMNSTLRARMLLAKDIADGNTNAVDVPLSDVVVAVKAMLDQEGFNYENASQQVFSVEVVYRVASMLKDQANSVENNRINFTYTKADGSVLSVPFVVCNNMLNNMEEVERVGYVRVQGLLADILQAIVKGLCRSARDTDGVRSIELTDSSFEYIVKDIAKARDNGLGKDLTRIATHGIGGHIVVSPVLGKNEMFGYNLLASKIKAEGSYQEHVAAIYFKPPTLWEGSLTGAKVLNETSIFSILKTRGVEEFFDLLFVSKEYHTIMNGNSAYHSPEKVLFNGNDVDGDRYVVVFVSNSVASYMPTLGHNHFVDATSTKVAVAGNRYKAKWDEEIASLYVSSVKDSLAVVTYNHEEFAKAIHKAVLDSAGEKKNVAVYTSYQMLLLNKKDAFMDQVERSLFKAIDENSVKNVMSISGTVEVDFFYPLSQVTDKEFAVKYIAEQLFSFACGVLGSVVNIDAMDLIKRNEAGDKRLADLLSPFGIYYTANPKAVVSDNPMHVDRVVVEGGTTMSMNSRIKAVTNMLFGEDYGFSFERINNIFPVDMGEIAKRKFIARFMMLGLYAVGKEASENTDIISVLVKDNKLDETLESRLNDLAEAEAVLPTISNTSLIGFCFQVAEDMRGKRLISVK